METGLGKRIKARRLELHLTQEELSRRMGYKSKAAICKVERGEDNITSDRVTKFAEALNCSVAYLMGWNEAMTFNTAEEFEKAWNDAGGGRHPIDLTDDEYTIITNYRCCDDAFKDTVRRMLAYQSKMREIK